MDLLPVLKQHLEQYPAMTAQDCVKFIYQSVLGPSHLGRNGTPKVDYIANEMAKAPRRAVPFWESIGNGLVRLNLDSNDNALRPETIHKLFLMTAKKHQGSLEQLKEQLSLWEAAGTHDAEEVAEELRKLAESDYAPVSHSEVYHQAYDPHYRLICESFTEYIPLLQVIDKRLNVGEKTFLAIDGRCASGKTTLSAFLTEIYDCDCIHIDDFFLPFERKTPERLSEPGGNLDRERFYQEVILPYKAAEPIVYGVYDCSVGSINSIKSAAASPVLIVEGSYSMHPLMAEHYDIKVFSICKPELQSQRILIRNGEEMHKRFINSWIPMEEKYFTACNIKENCDFIFDSSDK